MDEVAKRQALHGEAYARHYETGQDPFRLGRLMSRLALPPAARIVDVGCGNARILEAFVTQAADIDSYLGVDFSAELLAFAHARQERLGFTQAQFVHGSLVDACQRVGVGWADVALGLDVSEHVPDAEWLTACRGVRQLLKPGGVFYLHTPNRDFFIERMKAHNFLLKQFPEHVAVRTAAHNAAILREAGFTDVKVEFLPHYNWLRILHGMSGLLLVGNSLRARLFITAR